jgi:DNA-3-methyladenine glycosylase I
MGRIRKELGAVTRCPWAGEDPLYQSYHDKEWGFPERDSRALFEKLTLDGFQAGLAWITILRKRENFRRAFDAFDPKKIARYTPARVEKLLKDPGIIRHRGKIESTISNARAYLEIEDFSSFLWDFVGGKPIVNHWKSIKQVPAETKESLAMSKALRDRGFRFVGPTIVYAFMQAVGMVDDHLLTCFRRR